VHRGVHAPHGEGARRPQARAVLTLAGGTLAIIGGMTGLAFLVPLLLCLGSSAAVTVYFWLQR